jgi:leucyl-tRNA synthetase
LHIGHALNKITKDIICRFQVGQGKRVSYVPGWDCHGLPIEIKALQAQANEGIDKDPVRVRKAARKLATRTIKEQKKGFKEWAVMGDWDNAYNTMESGFEIRQLEVFKSMFEKGECGVSWSEGTADGVRQTSQSRTGDVLTVLNRVDISPIQACILVALISHRSRRSRARIQRLPISSSLCAVSRYRVGHTQELSIVRNC